MIGVAFNGREQRVSLPLIVFSRHLDGVAVQSGAVLAILKQMFDFIQISVENLHEG